MSSVRLCGAIGRRSVLRGGLAPTYAYAFRRHASFVSSRTAAKPEVEGTEPLTYEQRLEMLDVFDRRGLPAGYDMQNAPIHLLDHRLPVPLSQVTSTKGLKGIWEWIRGTTSNHLQNAVNLFFLARQKPFLGLRDVPTPKRRWSPQVFRVQSVSPNSWLAPLRDAALRTYVTMNEAQSSGDVKALSNVTQGRMRVEATQRLKGSKDKLLVWKYHGEAEPIRCLSLRTLDNDTPDQKKRTKVMIAQVLMKLDTLQSLRIYDKRTGKLLKEMGTPEKPMRVAEYMVFERRLLSDGRWYIRDQLFPGALVKVDSLADFQIKYYIWKKSHRSAVRPVHCLKEDSPAHGQPHGRRLKLSNVQYIPCVDAQFDEDEEPYVDAFLKPHDELHRAMATLPREIRDAFNLDVHIPKDIRKTSHIFTIRQNVAVSGRHIGHSLAKVFTSKPAGDAQPTTNGIGSTDEILQEGPEAITDVTTAQSAQTPRGDHKPPPMG
ncbi:hypothetical protein FRB99_008348 [Tulasnella sp. 403]|nr:hypothetical protein FRB99_008348 [Tulasnella sp. 403]